MLRRLESSKLNCVEVFQLVVEVASSSKFCFQSGLFIMVPEGKLIEDIWVLIMDRIFLPSWSIIILVRNRCPSGGVVRWEIVVIVIDADVLRNQVIED